MPITPTTNLSLNMYSDGDNAGAGATNSSAPTNTGLNGNWHKLDALVGGITTTAGVILPNKVTTSAIDTGAVTDTKLGANAVVSGKIALSATDNSTLEVNAGILRVKEIGVDTAQIKDNAVTTAKILNDNVTTAKILDRNVTANKIETDCTRTKVNFIFTKNTATGTGYFGVGNVTGSSDVGIMMLRAGSITGIYAMTGTGTLSNTALKGVHTFAIGDKLQVYVSGIQGEGIPPYTISTRLNGGATDKLTISSNSIGATATMIVNVEVEYD